MNNPNLTTFYMVRHGQTEWNAQGLVQGSSDSPLTKEGEKGAQELADTFKNVKFDQIFSSDLARAKRTAEIIVLEKKLAIQTTELLRERSFGPFEGKKYTELLKLHDSTISKLTDAERFSYKHSDGYESDEEVTNRFMTFIREVAVANPGKTILIVSHGSFMRLSLIKLGFGTYKTLPPRSIQNGGWVKFETDGVDFFIKEYEGIRKPENVE